MSEKRQYWLNHQNARANAANECRTLPDGWRVTFEPPNRSLPQNAKLHAIIGDIVKSGAKWAGKERSAEQWKVLLVSGHSEATRHDSELVPGIEGELVNLRESTASMSKARGSSLIEYALAFCAHQGIKTACTL